jgi:hypothetical protein
MNRLGFGRIQIQIGDGGVSWCNVGIIIDHLCHICESLEQPIRSGFIFKLIEEQKC